MKLQELIRKDSVFFVDGADRTSVIADLATKSLATGLVRDPDYFRKALVQREALMSTGIGLGVAVPHVKLTCIDEFFVTLGILKTPVEWDAIDHKPVDVVFLIGGPDGRQGTYLTILSQIVLVVKDEAKFARLKQAQTAEDVLAVLS